MARRVARCLLTAAATCRLWPKLGYTRQSDRKASKITVVKAVKTYAVVAVTDNSANNVAIIIKITIITAVSIYICTILLLLITMTSIIITIPANFRTRQKNTALMHVSKRLVRTMSNDNNIKL